jgi:hypothetical protein
VRRCWTAPRSKYGFVGAGALVPPGKTVGEAELWVGNPARCVRRLDDKAIEGLLYSAAHYVRVGRLPAAHARGLSMPRVCGVSHNRAALSMAGTAVCVHCLSAFAPGLVVE